jgi:alkanesulfonate monooxygenase SsuD/methylene tetrahydromethanopterin reductase-like flavin-dependent oxidoreductase (luciferase family)
MRFGLFCLAPQRDIRRDPGQIGNEAVEQAQLAESLDFETVWFAEHHFSNYSMIPSPLLMAAYCAGKTRKIRVGTGVLVLPLYEPVRLIEEIAFVDQVSGGRLHLGLGSGYQDYEFKRFGRNLAHSHAVFLEFLDLIENSFVRGEIACEGTHFKIPPTAIGLRPVQKPMPPIYIAGLAQDVKVQERLARSGYVPFLPQHHRPASALADTKKKIQGIWKSVGRDSENLPLATQRTVFVTNDKKQELEAAEHMRYTLRMALGLRFNTAELDGPVLREMPVANEPSLEEILRYAPIGSPERVAEVLLDDICVLRPSHLSCMMQFGGMPQQQTLRSMELFGGEVMPMLRKELGDLGEINGDDVAQYPLAATA